MAQQNYKKFVATAATATLVASAIVPVASANVSTAAFTDVGSSYKEAVDFLVSNNISKGYSETQYGVQMQIKRGDAAVMIANAAGLNDKDAAASGFSDVPTRAALAVNSLKAAGVVNGKTTTKFGFEDNLTRGEAAIMLQRAFKLKAGDVKNDFTDVKDSYDAAVDALVANKVTKGINDTQFGTANNIKRGDFAKFLFALKDQIIVGVSVEEVTVVNETTTTVKLKDAKKDLTAADFKVLVNDEAVTPEKVESDAKGEVYTITHPSLKGSKGIVSVNGKQADFDFVTGVQIDTVKATNAKTLTVTFNKAVDTEKAMIEVKRGSVKPSIKEIKFSEDKKSATVEFNTALAAGDYTATVTGLSDQPLTGTTKVEAEKLTEINFLSDVAVKSGNNIKVNVEAKNQYGEVVNGKLPAGNISVSASKGTTGHSIDKNGVLTVNGNASSFNVDDKVVVTVVDSTTGVTATKTLTVAQAADVNSIVLGEIKTDDAELAKEPVNVTNMDTDYAKYYIPVTIKDQYGNTLKAADLVGVNVLSSNENIVKFNKFEELTNGQTVIKLAQPTSATNGTAVLTVVSAGTGKTASVSVKVNEDSKTDVITVSSPESALKISQKTELPFSAADQFGNALVSSTDFGTITQTNAGKLTFADGSSITATGANIESSIDYGNKNKVKLHVTPTAKNIVLTAVSATGKAQTLSLTAEAAPEAATLAGLSKDLYMAMQKDETQDVNFTDVIVKDQYGEDISLPNNYSLTFTAVDGTLDTVTIANPTITNTGTTKAVVTAAAKGTEAVEITLKDDNSDVLDTVTVNLETVELKDISTFGLKEIGKLYSGSTFKYGNSTAQYNNALEIFGKKGSKEVLVDQGLLISSTATSPLVVAANNIVQASNQIATSGADKKSTVTGVIAGADAPLTVTQEVTYSDAKSVVSDLMVRKTSGAKTAITNGAVVVSAADLNVGTKVNIGTKATSANTAGFQFYAEDQYGVVPTELSYTVTNVTAATATGIAVSNTGAISKTGGTYAAGDSFTVTAIVDGVVKSVKVIVGA
ncbi:S-layer homology domain-containing protein [Sporosarcina aquimarina]|uniref:S-layer homology domain-containing protein n=1 Tax=Sporosarcina aquimarina TaxID=114975 RepID=A0ABU4FX88_9BACL|nr:S-layer homology domain-containing protein [Sporosarcina aquimarina]MDW0108698.1 S-layer homology domain-containing protein [Sporosarcina aquimarina]